MLDAMESLGFRILDYEFKSLTEADAEEIYRTNHPIREGNSWHVARLVYSMGRSLGLLLGVSNPAACACAQMQRFKGKANPSLSVAGQLRYDFLAPNRCLSLMHSSDDFAKVRAESAVFFTTDRLDVACRAARTGVKSDIEMRNLLAGARSELGIESINEPGVGALFARVRLRLTRDLDSVLSSTARATLATFRSLWEPMSREEGRRPVLAEAARYMQIVAQERPILDTFAAQLEVAHETHLLEFYRPGRQDLSVVLNCLGALNETRHYPRWDSEAQLPQSVLFDRWERLLFRTHLFNFDDLLGSRG
jgi:nucleoside diphosphate kinase